MRTKKKKKKKKDANCPPGTCSLNEICSIAGSSYNSHSCTPDPRTVQVTPFNPLVRWAFNGNNLDASGHNINFTTTQQQSYASVYQNQEPYNQALVLNGGPSYGTSSQVIPFPDQFAIQVIFNLNSLSASYNFVTVSSSTGSIFSVDGNSNGKIQVIVSGKAIISTSDLIKTGRTYSLVITYSYNNNLLTLFLNDVKHGGSSSFTFTAGDYFVSSGKGLIGYLDEVGVYSQPVYATTVSSVDSLLARTKSCPSGQSCYNSINGPACA